LRNRILLWEFEHDSSGIKVGRNTSKRRIYDHTSFLSCAAAWSLDIKSFIFWKKDEEEDGNSVTKECCGSNCLHSPLHTFFQNKNDSISKRHAAAHDDLWSYIFLWLLFLPKTLIPLLPCSNFQRNIRHLSCHLNYIWYTIYSFYVFA